MPAELCPKCLSVQNMRVETSTRETPDSEGKNKKIKTSIYHCELCNSFVRSEDQVIAE
ncbi:MAG TPA: hypothetical protein VKF81_02520 [Blastocatellia bacterium]|nr:hypothetical protein [Blastocatellia bacterium]